MLTPEIANKPAGVLKCADTLAREYYNGTPLRDLPERYQCDLVIEAEDRLAHYREQ